MPRPVWKGFISFGLVSIPVNATPVEETKGLHFHFIDERDKSRVRYQRINENTGQEVPWDKIVKGYEYDKDEYVILNDEDFQRASPETYKSIDIAEFVNYDEIDPLYFDKPYYLLPDSKNKKAYVLLREALKKTNKVGVAKVVIRTKEYLSLIMPHNHSLLLNLIHFKEELREEKDLNLPTEPLKDYNISDQETKMAMDLIKTMTVKWQPEKYHNEYTKALMHWIDLKTKDKLPKRKPIPEHAGEVVDFIGLLKKSLHEKKPKAKQAKQA